MNKIDFKKIYDKSKNKTFNNDDVSLVLGNNLTVDDGVSLTIEDDAQVVVVPSSFFIQ